MSVTGEAGYSTAGKQAKRFTFDPIPTADYSLKLDCTHLEVAKREGDPTARPYINGLRLEALDTGKDGGKNSLVFAMLFTGITPSAKGNVAFEMANGPLGLAKALGAGDISVPADAIRTFPLFDDKGNLTGGTVKIVDPAWLIQWLKSYHGAVVKGHIRLKKEKDRDPRNEVAYYIEADAQLADANATSTPTEDVWADEVVETATKSVPQPPAPEVVASTATKNGVASKPKSKR